MKLFAAAMAIFTALVVPALADDVDVQDAVLWSDLSDIVQYAPKAMPDAVLIESAIQKSDPRYDMHIEYDPTAETGGADIYRGSMLALDASGQPIFRKLEVEVGGSPRAVMNVKIAQEIPLSQMHFAISVGLVSHLLVIEDATNDVRIVYPIGNGGLDENAMGLGKRLLTPLFQRAKLIKSTIIPHRKDPSYYRSEPFMPITNARGITTAIGFHITILSDSDWAKKGPNYLVRGFDSHGCMRLRQKDLRELFAIIMGQPDPSVPVSVDYFVWKMGQDGKRHPSLGEADEIHPYPVREDGYKRVISPVVRDSKEHLVEMEDISQSPDLNGMVNFTADDIKSVEEFNRLSGEMLKEH